MKITIQVFRLHQVNQTSQLIKQSWEEFRKVKATSDLQYMQSLGYVEYTALEESMFIGINRGPGRLLLNALRTTDTIDRRMEIQKSCMLSNLEDIHLMCLHFS